MAYEKQIWNKYDDLKTEEENIENGAVVTDNRMNHIEEGIEAHTADLKNPHSVTAAQVGLGNVQNFGLATEDEAKQGTSNAKYMTPSLTQAVLSANINSIAYANSADGTDGFTTVYPNLNLLDGTKDFSGNWGNSSSWVTDGTYKGLTVKKITGQWNGIYKKFIAPKDGTYTFSAYIKSSGNSANVYRYGAVNSTNNLPSKFLGSNFDWTRDSVTVNLKANDSIYFRYEISGTGADSILWVAGHKWEPGSTATPYMPSSSEVTTADWPKFVGFSNTVKTNKSASDYTWFPVKDSELTNKANDSEVVHKTGDEEILGSKSFEEIKINGKTIIDLLHPVGSYYITNDSTDPSKIFGIGTWVRVKGRVLVGVDENDAALLSPNNTGGSVNPLSSHTHDYSRSGAGAITTGGTPSVTNQIAAVTSGGYWGSTATGYLQSSGDNTNHANWQPFQTAYMWYRSA